jgi:hypothetical protein
LVRPYSKRRTAEQWIKEGSEPDAAALPVLRSNEVPLWLSVIAYNLGNLWRRLVLRNQIGNWSLTPIVCSNQGARHDILRCMKPGNKLIDAARGCGCSAGAARQWVEVVEVNAKTNGGWVP